MLPIQDVIYTKCYENEPRQNVTARKCTIKNVTDPSDILHQSKGKGYRCESGISQRVKGIAVNREYSS